jgi:hypothetical protein
MKKIILSVLVLGTLTSCGTGGIGSTSPFKYNRKEACEINYGQNGISVIVDGNKIIVKNNRQIDYGSVLSVRTEDGTYATTGRYFSDSESLRLAKSLQNSKQIYLRWQKVGDNVSASDTFTTTINTSNFMNEFSKCLSEQGISGENAVPAPTAPTGGKTWLKL